MNDTDLCIMTTLSSSPSLCCNRRKFTMVSSPASTSSYQEKESLSKHSVAPASIKSVSLPIPIQTSSPMTSSVNSNSVTYQNIRILKLSSEKYSITGQPRVSPSIPFLNDASTATTKSPPVLSKPLQEQSKPIKPMAKRNFRKPTMSPQKLPSLKETIDEETEEDSNSNDKESKKAVTIPNETSRNSNSLSLTTPNLNISPTTGPKPIVRYKIYMVNDISNTTISSSLEKRHIQITNNTRVYRNTPSLTTQNQTGTNNAQYLNSVDEDLVRLHVNLKNVLYKH